MFLQELLNNNIVYLLHVNWIFCKNLPGICVYVHVCIFGKVAKAPHILLPTDLALLAHKKGNWVADKHIAGYFRPISMIFHEPGSDQMNTNKLIGKFNLGQLIFSPLHCGLEKLQMTPRLMIQLTEIHAHNIK